MTEREFLSGLGERCERNGVDLSLELGSRLALYFELLAFWNRKMNLSGFALDNPSDTAIDRLFVEPLVVAKQLERPVSAMIDIGSGGGSPAVPMLLALTPKRATLVESRSRKSTFLREVLRTLEVSSWATVEESRFESLACDNNFVAQFQLLTVRAVRVGPDELRRMASFVLSGGNLAHFGGIGPSATENSLFTAAEPISLETTGETIAILFTKC